MIRRAALQQLANQWHSTPNEENYKIENQEELIMKLQMDTDLKNKLTMNYRQ